VADTLELFDKKVTNDPKVLKEVSNLKGVGKGSIAIVSTPPLAVGRRGVQACS
jgi:hypothetical protein